MASEVAAIFSRLQSLGFPISATTLTAEAKAKGIDVLAQHDQPPAPAYLQAAHGDRIAATNPASVRTGSLSSNQAISQTSQDALALAAMSASATAGSDGRFHCEICNASFTLKNNLRRHLLTHGGVTRHACRYCGKGYTRSDECTAHERSHETNSLTESTPSTTAEPRMPYAGASMTGSGSNRDCAGQSLGSGQNYAYAAAAATDDVSGAATGTPGPSGSASVVTGAQSGRVRPCAHSLDDAPPPPSKVARHMHAPGCGHPAVWHGDHIDFVVDGHLHHQHTPFFFRNGGVHHDHNREALAGDGHQHDQHSSLGARDSGDAGGGVLGALSLRGLASTALGRVDSPLGELPVQPRYPLPPPGILGSLTAASSRSSTVALLSPRGSPGLSDPASSASAGAASSAAAGALPICCAHGLQRSPSLDLGDLTWHPGGGDDLPHGLQWHGHVSSVFGDGLSLLEGLTVAEAAASAGPDQKPQQPAKGQSQ